MPNPREIRGGASESRIWRVPASGVNLRHGEVHVWRAGLDVDAAVLERLRATLSADEQARAARFYAPIDQLRYSAAHGILRNLLGQYLRTPADGLRFTFNARGKPAVAAAGETGDLRFNLSHSRHLALFAFAWGREVGVDVEFIDAQRDHPRLAERFFSASEAATLQALPESEQTEGFFRCWTRKEAYIKARGEGLSICLASFAVSLDPIGKDPMLITGMGGHEAGGWSLRGLSPGEGFAGAVAAEGSEWSMGLHDWE